MARCAASEISARSVATSIGSSVRTSPLGGSRTSARPWTTSAYARRAQAVVIDLLRGAAARLVNDGAPKDVLKQAIAAAGKGDVDDVAALVEDYPRLLDQRAATVSR